MHTIELIRLLVALACVAAGIARVRNHLSRREQRQSMSSPRPSSDNAFPEVNHRYDAVDAAPVDTGGVSLKNPPNESAS